MLKTLVRRAAGALGLSLLLAAAPAQAKAPVVRPALWTVADADTTIYLFGTIHLLPDQYPWQTPALKQAEASSQGLVIETIVDPAHPQPMMSALLQLGFAPGQLPPLRDRVPPAKQQALLDAVAKSGTPEKQFDQMKTWNAAFQLLQVQFREMGLLGKEGPETVLRKDFAATGKPVDQLETNAEQLAFFDRLPEASQRQLLEGSIEPLPAARQEFTQMLTSWSRGDVNGIARSFNQDLASAPEVQKSLIRQRNANWSQWIEQRMSRPGTIMIAVGAGHLAGNDSVIELLKKDGYKVKRLQ
jgi:uncharacterized protein YbaP (TraB family)